MDRAFVTAAAALELRMEELQLHGEFLVLLLKLLDLLCRLRLLQSFLELSNVLLELKRVRKETPKQLVELRSWVGGLPDVVGLPGRRMPFSLHDA